MSDPIINIEMLDCMVNRLKALPIQTVLQSLNITKEEKSSVSEIQAHLNLEQASTSNHLRILRDQQIVTSKRAGKNKYYFN